MRRGAGEKCVRERSCLLTCSSLVKVRSHMLHCLSAMTGCYGGGYFKAEGDLAGI